MKKKSIALMLALALVFSVSVQALAMYDYEGYNDSKHFIGYMGNGKALTNNGTYLWDPVAYPAKSADATFTASPITVDGAIDEAWAAATAYPIANKKNADGSADANGATGGTLKLLWDGPVLYLLVQVTGDATIANVNNGTQTAGTTYPNTVDSVTIGYDAYNDHFGFETDSTGIFTVTAKNQIVTFSSVNIPSLSSPFSTTSPEYCNRLKETAVTATEDGYIYEIALQMEGKDIETKNGMKVGLEVAIHDCSATASQAWIYWSHSDSKLYARPDSERAKGGDWGTVTLAGWDGETAQAYSDWRAKEAIRWYGSKTNPGGNDSVVWTQATRDEFFAAKTAFEALTAESTRMEKDAAVDRVWDALYGLRWADTTYPDPADLPRQNTLPDPYKFFDESKGTDGYVVSADDWFGDNGRRAEILDLVQFYEHGYKPGVESVVVNSVTGTTATSRTISVTVNANGKSVTYNLTLSLPTAAQLAASGIEGSLPVTLGASFTAYGFAALTSIGSWTVDMRTDAIAWGTRTGLFYTLYPYARNSTEEVSAEMAWAYGASRAIDALELVAAGQVVGTNVGLPEGITIDPSKIAVKGFSINGKYAFVAGVFDERIGVTIPGASGASGTSPWRFVYHGHQYDWTGTRYYNTTASANMVAFGTEMIGNSVRHNRVRETELFRHFMNLGHMYEHEEGAYGFATRLPFDQNDMIATLAPRAIIINNTVNDCDDGCEADALGAQVAKSVYENLGFDADDLVRFNYRPYVNTGDPHGSNAAQTDREAEYMKHYFCGMELSAATDEWLGENPFLLPISNGATESPFDYYYGGLSNITGGTEEADGWYYTVLPADTAALESLIADAAVKLQGSYTAETYAALEAAYNAAVAVMENIANTRQLTVNEAADTLRAALDGLVKKATVMKIDGGGLRSVKKGKTLTLDTLYNGELPLSWVVLTPANISIKVSEDGLSATVTGLKAGTAMIAVKTTDGSNITTSITISVTN